MIISVVLVTLVHRPRPYVAEDRRESPAVADMKEMT
jgi:hypothetical protein